MLPTITFALCALVCGWGLVDGLAGRTRRGGMLVAAGVAGACVLATAGAVAFVVVVAAIPLLESRKTDHGVVSAGWRRAAWVGLGVLGLAGVLGSLGARLYVTYGADVGPFAPWGQWTELARAAAGQQLLAIAALCWVAAVMFLASRAEEAEERAR